MARRPCCTRSNAPPHAGAQGRYFSTNRPSLCRILGERRIHLARDVAIEAAEAFGRRVADPGIRCQHVDGSQAVPRADLEVRRVVRRCHLHGPRSEGGIHCAVRNDRDETIDQRRTTRSSPARAREVVFIVWSAAGNAGVAQHRFRTGGRDADEPAAVLERIREMPERTFALLPLHFLVRERGKATWTPVHDILAAT